MTHAVLSHKTLIKKLVISKSCGIPYDTQLIKCVTIYQPLIMKKYCPKKKIMKKYLCSIRRTLLARWNFRESMHSPHPPGKKIKKNKNKIWYTK
jgi:hypothetical protein